MAKEVRSILFTAEETRNAVSGFLLGRIRGLHPYAVEQVDIKVADGVVQAYAFMRRDRSDAPAVLDSQGLLTAVLMHCRGARIPLSNRSSKRLDISNGCLVLTMSMNADPAPPRVEGNTVVHSAPVLPSATSRIV